MRKTNLALIKEKKDTDEEGSSYDDEESSSSNSSQSSSDLKRGESKLQNFSNDRARTSKVTFAPQALIEPKNNGLSKLIGLNLAQRVS